MIQASLSVQLWSKIGESFFKIRRIVMYQGLIYVATDAASYGLFVIQSLGFCLYC